MKLQVYYTHVPTELGAYSSATRELLNTESISFRRTTPVEGTDRDIGFSKNQITGNKDP